MSQVKMSVDKIGIDLISHDPVIILRSEDGEHMLPITIGVFEATSISFAMEHINIPRPIAHDLMAEMLRQLDVELTKVVIADIKAATYYAQIVLNSSQGEIVLDARPSDSVAIALRLGAPIYAEERVLNAEGIRDVNVITRDEAMETYGEDVDEEDFEESEEKQEAENSTAPAVPTAEVGSSPRMSEQELNEYIMNMDIDDISGDDEEEQ